jgi:hypothetical protein
VAVCGELLPPGPVAVAVYVVVCVGVSCALPETCDPLTTSRVAEPSDAVIVTDVALDVCQFNVTLCPLLIVLVFVEKVIVGATFVFELPQDVHPQIAVITTAQKIQRAV